MTTEQIHVFHHEDPDFSDVRFVVRYYGKMGSRDSFHVYFESASDVFDDSTPRIFNSEEHALSLVEGELGFIVKFWRDLLNGRDEKSVVANGRHYRIGKEGEPFPGFGGSRWTFRNLSTGELIVSSNVWTQGEIPLFAREMFPDTHEVVMYRPFTLRESVLLALATGEDLTAAVVRVRAEKYWRDLGMGATVSQLEMLVREGHVRRRGQPAMYSIILPGAER